MLPANIFDPYNSDIGTRLNNMNQKLIFNPKSKLNTLKIHIKIKLNSNPKNTIIPILKYVKYWNFLPKTSFL